MDSTARSIYVSPEGNVYAAGYFQRDYFTYVNMACYWENGIFKTLDLEGVRGSSTANAVTTSGGDVYVAGSVIYETSNDSPMIACYWKNGTLIPLDHTGITSIHCVATAIAVDNGDVYVTGHYVTNEEYFSYYGWDLSDLVSCYWKNGVRYELEGKDLTGISNSWFFATAVLNGNMYIAGDYLDDVLVRRQACIWENGARKDLTVPAETRDSLASVVGLYNGKVYAAGFYGVYIDGNLRSIPCYWVDGERFDMEAVGDANIRALTVYNGMVFVAGYYYQGARCGPCYWVNGERRLFAVSGDRCQINDSYIVVKSSE